MNDLKVSIIIGSLASLVPIYLQSFAYDDRCIKNGISYPNSVRSIIPTFIFINIVSLYIFRKLNIKNYFLIGAVLSVIYSSMGRYYKVPQKVFGMNPNKFQLQAIFLWSIIYGIIGFLLKNIYS